MKQKPFSGNHAGWQTKVDHRLRVLWDRIPEPERKSHKVNALLRFTGTAEVIKELRAEIHSISGYIASVGFLLSDLPLVAGSDEVIFIELAQPLKTDQ